MARTSATHLDRRRQLHPRAYLVDPWTFGTDTVSGWRIPPGGDEVSLRVAQMQHRVIAEWNRRGRVPGAGVLCRRYAMSKQVLSRVVLGQRWAGETVLAALIEALTSPQRTHTGHRTQTA